MRDGKIVVAGRSGPSGEALPAHFALARYTTRGRLDARFAKTGTILTDFKARPTPVSAPRTNGYSTTAYEAIVADPRARRAKPRSATRKRGYLRIRPRPK